MQTSRWPISHLPISGVTPFTYRDGETYLSMLNRLAQYVTEQLHPNLRKTVEHMVEELEQILAAQHGKYVEGIQDFQRIHDAFMTDVNSALMALNDHAVADLVDNQDSALGGTLREVFPTRDHLATEKRKLWVDVTDYGAAGDGSTDDVSAIQSAINDIPATGGTVFFPAGEYRVGTDTTVWYADDTMIRIPSNITLLGHSDATIIDNAGSGDMRIVFWIDGSDVRVTGLSFVNEHDPAVSQPEHMPIVVGERLNRVLNKHINNIVIEHCSFHHAWYAISVQTRDSYYTIKDVAIRNNTGKGFGVHNCGGFNIGSVRHTISQVTIENNVYDDVTVSAAYGVSGTSDVVITGNRSTQSGQAGAGIQLENGCQHVTIQGNNMVDHYNGIWVDDSSHVTVQGNTVRNTEARTNNKGIRVTVQGFDQEPNYEVRGIVIEGNTLFNTRIHNEVFGTAYGTGFIRDITIANNIVNLRGGVDYGIVSGAFAKRVNINNNTVIGAAVSSIRVSGSTEQRVAITGNITDVHDGEDSIGLEFVNQGASGYPIIANNQFHNGTSLSGQSYATVGDKRIVHSYSEDAPNFQAPVGSLLLHGDGHLYIKTGQFTDNWQRIQIVS